MSRLSKINNMTLRSFSICLFVLNFSCASHTISNNQSRKIASDSDAVGHITLDLEGEQQGEVTNKERYIKDFKMTGKVEIPKSSEVSSWIKSQSNLTCDCRRFIMQKGQSPNSILAESCSFQHPSFLRSPPVTMVNSSHGMAIKHPEQLFDMGQFDLKLYKPFIKKHFEDHREIFRARPLDYRWGFKKIEKNQLTYRYKSPETKYYVEIIYELNPDESLGSRSIEFRIGEQGQDFEDMKPQGKVTCSPFLLG